MQTRKTRHQFYLPDHLSARLDALATEPDNSKTAILTAAVAAWFEQREAASVDAQFGRKIDRQARVVERMERRVDYLTELVGLFVKFHLTQTAHHPAFDAETRRLGAVRYQEFMRLVGVQAAKGRAGGPAAD